MTVSTMPFRKKTDLNQRFSDFTRSQFRLPEILSPPTVPYDELIKELQLAKQGYDQLFQMYINSYNTDLASDIDGCHVEYDELYNGSQPYSFKLQLKNGTKAEQSNCSSTTRLRITAKRKFSN